MRSVAERVISNVDRLLRKDRLLFDSRFYYSERLWVICDEHFKQTFNPRTKQLSATSVKQKYGVTLESYSANHYVIRLRCTRGLIGTTIYG